MKKEIPVIIAAITIFTFLSCKKELSTPNNKLNSVETVSDATMTDKVEDKGVPFKGEYTTSFQVLQPGLMFIQRVTGTGNATHLGNSIFVAITNVNRSTPPPFAVSGTRTFTAANGDQFFTTFTGSSMPVAPGYTKTRLHDVITGGTGRFLNASGSFDTDAVSDQNTSTFVAKFDGYIKF